MKKMLCVLTIVLLASCSCEENEQIPEIHESQIKHNMYKGHVKHYTYEGHKYLTFGSFESIIHDPDCPCYNDY